MSVGVGTRIGSYEIVAAIGVGGMGEVYRARDTNLRRDVALKILPEAFAHDPDRCARFEREAHALASLNHPNIAQIHGFEASVGTRALVMELVDGEDLSAIIARGPIAVADALPIARQITDALEAAHDAGIVHRDLKPANVKVRDDGTVKVRDFGLAKALADDPDNSLSTQARTMTSPAQTQHGVILGTASYMSPEQARGRPVDKRADLWAFGVVMFEMLTGRVLFPGETVTDVLASVVTRETDWTSLPAGTPPAMRRLLRRCLEKDPKRRLHDAADARIEIEEARHELEHGVNAGASVQTSAPRGWVVPIGLAAASLAIGVALGAMVLSHSPDAVTPFQILNLKVPTASASSAELSPDGRWVAAVFDRKILVKGMDESVWRELPGTDGASTPLVWAPDSRRVAFPMGNSLRKVDLVGSRPITICDRCLQQNSLRGGSWNGDGVILLGGSPEDLKLGNGLLMIPENGGAMKGVTAVDTSRGENSHRYPAFLPDGQRFTFTVRRDNGEHEIRVGDLSGSPTRLLVSGFSKTAYASGYLLFARDEALLAVPFDAASATSSGDPVKVADRLAGNVGTALFSFSVSTNGTLAYGEAPATRGYVLLDRYGRKLADVTTRQSDGGGRFSPDGKRAAIAEMDPEKSSTDIYVIDVATGARTRLTSDPAWEQQPAWSPEGTRVAYRQGPAIYIQDADGRNRHKVGDLGSGSAGFVHDWSADGKHLLLTQSAIAGSTLAKLSIADGRIETLGANETTEASDARLSHDGGWVAFISKETGSAELHIRSFPDFQSSHRVTTTGGDTPLWSRDGKELFYRDSDGWIVVVGVRVTGRTIETSPPQRLFRPNTANTWGVGYQHDVDAHGRFFVYRVGDDTGSFANSLVVMQNWTKAIRK